MTNPQNFRNNVEDSYPTSDGDTAVVVGYKRYEEVIVKFLNPNTPEDFTFKCQLGDLRRNRVKNPFTKGTYGVGYKGWGIYLTAKNGINTSAWKRWSHMLSRCYVKSNSRYANYGGRGVTICEEWHNFQNYACWYYQNYVEEYEVDKDLINSSSKIYSPESCCFLPREINLFIKNKTNIGVWFDKKISKYVSQSSYKGRHKILGRFRDEQDAQNCYKNFKVESAKELAEDYKNSINSLAYTALINYGDRFNETLRTEI